MPNVVVLMTDDQTPGSLRVMPNVRRLIGGAGTTFRQSIVTSPICSPSRATFLTGQYASNHGVMTNAPPDGGYVALDHANTLPVWLQRSGYSTAHVGKYLHGYGDANATEIPPGWNEWHASVSRSTYDYYGYTLNENGRLRTYSFDTADYQTDVFSQRAVDLVRVLAARTQPFFLSVAFLAPHAGRPREKDDPLDLGIHGLVSPVPAPRHRNRYAAARLPRPPSFNERDVRDKPVAVRRRTRLRPHQVRGMTEIYQQRLESLLAVDEAVAAIVAELARVGELDNTLIVYTSDNGFFHGEHRFLHGKGQVYEPAIRVPLLLRGPGLPAGATRDTLVANVDLAPTIMDVADAQPGRVMDGRSLLPLLRHRGPWKRRDLLVQNRHRVRFDAIRTPRYVYAEYGNGERELYDLRRDPHQLTSKHRSPAYQARRKELARRLALLRP